MPEPLVKICGLSTIPTLEAAIGAGADMIGLMHFPKSPRHVSLATAATLAGKSCGRTDIVVVTVDPDDALIDAIAADVKPDWIQLHGQESPERVAQIAARGKARVIKALGIRSAEDIAKVAPYHEIADLLLLDAKPPKDATRPGGMGVVFDWGLLNQLPAELRFLLSGGLTVHNVQNALRETRAIGLDLSSGVESAPGVKDPDLIREFLRLAKSTRQSAQPNGAPVSA